MISTTQNGIAFADIVSSATALATLPEPVACWFARRYGEPTPAQRCAWPVLAAGQNLLLSAPTGTGKTLAAFLPVLGHLITESQKASYLEHGVRCLCVAPLKALSNDACRNLQTAIEELIPFLPPGIKPPSLAVRTGDTSARQRQDQRQEPPDLLLTTPESLAVLLSQPSANHLFASLRTAIIDEVHAIAPTKRGADLALSLERLETLANKPLQRIGLSATIAPLETAARFLVGKERHCVVASVSESASLELIYRPLEGGSRFLRQLITVLEPELRANRATLVFANTRGLSERLAWTLRRALPDWDDQIAVHHSALAAERRQTVEEAFKRGELRVVVSSTSLESGIDIGSVDLVVLVHPPGDVIRLLQRVGRAGHGPGRIKRGLVLTATAAELLEAAVTGESSRSAQCEALRLPVQPLDVLCQQMLGMASAGPCTADEVFALVRRAEPYSNLERRDFDDCLTYLFGHDRFGQPWLPARLKGDVDNFIVRNASTARLLRCNLGTILAEETTPVLCRMQNTDEIQNKNSSDNAAFCILHSAFPIGEVDRAFAERLQPGDRFLLDGRCLEMRRLEAGTLLVDEVTGRPAVPRWSSDGWPLSAELARRLYSLRIQAAEALREGPAALADLLNHDYDLGNEATDVLATYFERQEALSEIPDGDGILVESVGSVVAIELYIHTPLNRLANDALARVATHRLARDYGRSADSIVADLGFALFVRGQITSSLPDLLRTLLTASNFATDFDAALSDSPTLRECFQRVATTGLMLLRNPLKGQRKVGGRDWGSRQLFDQIRTCDTDFVLLRQAVREVRTDLCDVGTALRFVEELPYRTIKCRHLGRPSPFAESWTQTGPGPVEEAETPVDALRRLHAILTGAGNIHARAQ